MTQANRQDIVTTSGRNIGIRRGIADAFIQAILEFCNHPKLQYTWMKFLPDKNQHFDPFWSQLVTLLEVKLQDTAVLRSRSEKSFHLISSLRFLLDSQLDRHGEPLFGVGSPEKHLSKNYSAEDIKILRTYGLTEYTPSEILLAISLDLNRTDSRMKSENMDDDWHTRSANYLSSIFPTGGTMLQSMLGRLSLLPLQDGTWIAAQNKKVFFPEANGLKVPPGLGLNIIVSKAAQNIRRRQLLCRLGVQDAEISFMRRQIFKKGFGPGTIISIVKQLQYLFLTDMHKTNSEDKRRILIVDSERRLQKTHVADVYMPDNNLFGPSKLLENVKSTDGLSAKLLNHVYVNEALQKDGIDLTSSWKDWLCSYVGVRRHLRIISKDEKDKLSKECLYVAAHHADKFLGYLRNGWDQESKDIKSSSSLTAQLSKIVVPCHGGKTVAIERTYLPLPNLKHQWEKFSRGSENFPFLKLDKEVTRETYVKDWGFLVSSLSVGVEDNTKFYLYVLLYIMSQQKVEEIDDSSRIFELYGAIYGKYLEASNDENKELIRYVPNSGSAIFESICSLFLYDRNVFQGLKLIYVPKSKYRASVHMSSNDCVWDGPESLSIKAPLLALYRAMPIKNLSTITLFITDVLGIGNCDEQIICAQLDNLRESGSKDFDRIKSLYSSLWQISRDKKRPIEAKELMK